MKNWTLPLALSTAFVCLLASAQDLKIEPKGSWRQVDDAIERTSAAAKADYSEIGLTVDLKPGKLYVLTWQAKSSVSEDGNTMLLMPKWTDQHQCGGCGYYLGREWREYRLYFHSGKCSGEERFVLLLHGPFAQTASVKDFKLSEISPSSEMLPAEVAESNGKCPPSLWFVHKYEPGTPYPLSCATDETTVEGISMELKSTDHPNVMRSIGLPVEPGAKYQFECWLKSSRDTAVNVTLNNWFNPHRDNNAHPDKGRWVKYFHFASTQEWKRLSTVVQIPADMESYPDFQAGTLSIFISGERDSTLWISGASFKRME